jgi:hypothetical protein
MISLNRLVLVIACTLTGIQPVNAAMMPAYTPSKQDMEVLSSLGEVPEKGMEYIRCEKRRCYYMVTGKYAGDQPTDGIYLVWPVSEIQPTKE